MSIFQTCGADRLCKNAKKGLGIFTKAVNIRRNNEYTKKNANKHSKVLDTRALACYHTTIPNRTQVQIYFVEEEANKMKKFVALLLAVLMVASLCACGQKDTGSDLQTVTKGKLIMSTNAEFAPYEYVADDGKGFQGTGYEGHRHRDRLCARTEAGSGAGR